MLLLGCDADERFEGIERVNDELRQGVIAANEEVESLQGELAKAQTRAGQAEEDRKAMTERIATLETALSALEAKVDAPPPVAAPAKPTPTLRPGRPDPAERYRVPIDGSATRGPDDAKVTLVMITDFQCPFCKRVQPTIRALEKHYGDDLRIVVKHHPLPMHPRARAAALAVEAAAEQDKFWELHDLLYDNSRALTDADLRKWAKEAGCNVARFKTDLGSAAVERRVDDDIELAKRVGSRGTPGFFINGRFLAGAQPQKSFEAVIDEELKEADRRIAAGTPQDRLYDTLMKSAKSGT